MFEKTIVSFQDYVDTVLQHDGNTLGYRGVSDKNYKLVPAIGRVSKDRQIHAMSSEQGMFNDFKKELVRFQKINTDIECAILAQHYGLPTRLLDWTFNPLVALHFAVNSKTPVDACIYLLSYAIDHMDECDVNYSSLFSEISFIIEIVNDESSPTSLDGKCDPEIGEYDETYYALHPSSTTERIVAQKSFFTLHCNPFLPIENEVHGKLIIPHELKKSMQDALELFGITSYTLFPDISGLATSLRQAYFSSTSS
ncbi:FRG domain-containing protein [Desulfovibrio falkowii]|uniref:FRG domain-containing protein n=1 Tax=Desulfovibrio sp. WGS1351 TaxID=3366814 RepID=UPI00372D305E